MFEINKKSTTKETGFQKYQKFLYYRYINAVRATKSIARSITDDIDRVSPRNRQVVKNTRRNFENDVAYLINDILSYGFDFEPEMYVVPKIVELEKLVKSFKS